MTSKKFIYIKSLSKKNVFSSYILPYVKIVKNSDLNTTFMEFQRKYSCPFILRSALNDEASVNKLRSGESISCPNINTFNEFNYACKKIYGQKKLHEVILQQQFEHSTHLTIFLDNSFTYIDYKGDKDGSFAEGPNFSTDKSKLPSYKEVKKLLNLIYNEFNTPLLIEAGINKNDIKLYQVVNVTPSMVKHLYSQESIMQVYYNNSFNYSPSLLNLLKVEFSAFLFRFNKNFNETNSVAMAYRNWFFLLHYFTLFCRINSLSGNDNDWCDFIQLGHKKNSMWLSKIVSKHIAIANLIRPYEKLNEMPSILKNKTEQPIFIGEGEYYEYTDNYNFKEELTIEDIISYSSSLPIISKSNSLLSHPVLLAAEKKIPLVLNISDRRYIAIKNSRKLFLDFLNKKIRLE